MTQFVEKTHFAFAQYIGDRDQQQDSARFISFESRGSLVAILADGMGGYEGGKIASETVIEAFIAQFAKLAENGRLGGNTVDVTKQIGQLTLEANNALKRKIESAPNKLAGMGTTFLSVFVNRYEYGYTSVGDSPLYFWSTQAKVLTRVNADHSMVPEINRKLIERDWSDAEKRKLLTQRSTLRSALIGEPLRLHETRAPFRANAGDMLLLASDGILAIEHHRIERLIEQNENKTATEICEKLMTSVREKRIRGQDNATVAVVVFPKADSPESVAS